MNSLASSILPNNLKIDEAFEAAYYKDEKKRYEEQLCELKKRMRNVSDSELDRIKLSQELLQNNINYYEIMQRYIKNNRRVEDKNSDSTTKSVESSVHVDKSYNTSEYFRNFIVDLIQRHYEKILDK